MSILSNRTERKAIKTLSRSLRFFNSLALLEMTEEDALIARAAENGIKSIIENNGYRVNYQFGKGTAIQKVKASSTKRKFY